MSKKVLKRVNVDSEMNNKISDVAKKRRLTHDEIINEALDYYFSDASQNNELQKEDIYTQRMNEMTQAIENLNFNVGNMKEDIRNRLNVLVEYNESPNYLKD
ncbi:hypothetical protein BU064_03495 [Staphylococcus succinus]|nr:hypothetical protein BU064_03495 [Staphylococcus succinus]RIM48165.1 hypothetical protein BUY22_02260 [Staphylococcus cohnii]